MASVLFASPVTGRYSRRMRSSSVVDGFVVGTCLLDEPRKGSWPKAYQTGHDRQTVPNSCALRDGCILLVTAEIGHLVDACEICGLAFVTAYDSRCSCCSQYAAQASHSGVCAVALGTDG